MTKVIVHYTTGSMEQYDCTTDPEQMYTFVVLRLIDFRKLYINMDSITSMEVTFVAANNRSRT